MAISVRQARLLAPSLMGEQSLDSEGLGGRRPQGRPELMVTAGYRDDKIENLSAGRPGWLRSSRMMCHRSSMAEHEFCKLAVVGSSPTDGFLSLSYLPQIVAAAH